MSCNSALHYLNNVGNILADWPLFEGSLIADCCDFVKLPVP